MFGFRVSAACAAALLLVFSGTVPAAPSKAGELSLPTGTTDMIEAAAKAVAAAETVPAEAPADPLPTPEAHERRTLAELVQAHSTAAPHDSEEECLAGAVYFEPKGEPLKGQLSVAEVILNRARSGRFPRTACGVVRQRGQFSFVRSGRFPPIARASAAWRTAVAIARVARRELASSPAGKALFFHAKRVSPRWRGVTRIASVGNHVFYR